MKTFITITLLICTTTLYADLIDSIEYEGLDRVEQAAIQDSITIKPGKEYNQDDIYESIKKLYEKDFFSNIKILRRGNTLVIKVKEKPMVDKIAFEGNEAASDEMLKNVINNRLGEGKLYSLHIIKDVLSDLQLMYKVLGFHSPVIKPQMINHPGNKIDIVFNIKEGEKTVIQKIIFIGNKAFSDDELKDLISMKEAKVWRFWDYDSHVFREDKVDVDIDAITKFYKSKGFPFFMVTNTHAEMSSDRKSHYCTFMMEEGDKYNIGKVSLNSYVKKVKAKDFMDIVKIKSGDLYNETKIFEIRDKLRKEVSLKEHPFIDVIVDINYNKEQKTANILYKIEERQKLFVERIDIVGNVRTLDRVIRRELSVHEGDALNVYKIQKSVDRLKGMEYFDDVQIDQEDGSVPDKKIIIVRVKEKESTAQLRFGLNMTDSDGIGGFIGIVENNLMGTGRMISADVMWMQRYYGLKIDLFDPRFFEGNVGAGIKIGGSRTERKKFESSAVSSLFISPYIRYAINENLIHRVGFTVSSNKKMWWNHNERKWMDHIPEFYQIGDRIFKPLNKDIADDEYGKYTTCELHSTLTYFDVDNQYEPRDGYDISMTNSYAGIMGNVKYFKNVFEGNIYRPINEKVTFVINGQLGHIKEISNTHSGDRFTLGGGYSMRGFDSYGIGTNCMTDEIAYDSAGQIKHLTPSNTSIGSTKYWTLSFMLKSPLSTKEMGINGVVFLDFGSAWGTKYDKRRVNDSSSVRASTGVAIEWAKCPLGMPMAFIFGFALKKKSFDEKQTFTLSGMM